MQPVKRQRLVDEVIHQLETSILERHIHVGSKLPPEAELMKRLGVGRSTLREAVGVLSHQGVLEVRQGDGTYVRARPGTSESFYQRVARASILEVYEARRGIELETSRLAALRRDDDDFTAIAAALEDRQRAYQTADWDAYVRADAEFHMSIARASKNSLLIDMYEAFATELLRGLTKLVDDPVMRYDEDTGHLHTQLLNAIANQDPSRAVQAAAENLDVTIRRIHELLQ